MLTSVFVSYPRATDYVLFRENLPKLLEQVDEVLICFTDQSGTDLSAWTLEQMRSFSKVRVCDVRTSEISAGDWRNKATNQLINMAKGDVLISLEQDVLIKDYTKFFSTVFEAMKTYQVVGFVEEMRIHPALLFFTREAINKTPRDFSVMGIGKDHFYDVSMHLKQQKWTTLQNLDLIATRDFYHFRGLTDNFHAAKPYYDLPRFRWYVEQCQKSTVDVLPEWRDKEKSIIQYLDTLDIKPECPFAL